MIPFDFLCTTRVGYRRESEVERLTHTPWGNKTTTIVQHVRENEQPNVFGRCGREINQRNKNRQREIHEIFSGHDNKTKDDRHNDNNKHQPNIGWLEWLERAAGTRAQAVMKKEKKKIKRHGNERWRGREIIENILKMKRKKWLEENNIVSLLYLHGCWSSFSFYFLFLLCYMCCGCFFFFFNFSHSLSCEFSSKWTISISACVK